jgi:DNA-binding transcriptional ArsR family regulator
VPRARKPRAAEIREPLSRIDRLLEHRVRLAIAVLLSRWDRLSFTRLKELTGETDGSLGAHMRRLEDAGYVSADKEFQDRKPVTWYALADPGRRALDAHLSALEDLIGPQ